MEAQISTDEYMENNIHQCKYLENLFQDEKSGYCNSVFNEFEIKNHIKYEFGIDLKLEDFHYVQEEIKNNF